MLACWPLNETAFQLGTESRSMLGNGGGGGVGGGGDVADSLLLTRSGERFELGCASGEASRALEVVAGLQAELQELSLRHARRSSRLK